MQLHAAQPYNKHDIPLLRQRTGTVMGDRYIMSPPHCLLVPLLSRAILTLKQFMKFFVTLPSMAESTLGNVIPPLHTELIIVALGVLIHQGLLVFQPSDIQRGLHCNTLSFSASLLNTALMRIAHCIN